MKRNKKLPARAAFCFVRRHVVMPPYEKVLLDNVSAPR